ncbi:MAG: penicillin-binding protein activator LpoB [Gemmatimonadetes bacterium]|nr:penicillin-binding protein activator LpoB [Gemmatimonadota bacterium]
MMKSRPLTSTASILVVAFLAASCSNKNVSRIEPDTVTDLSGQWNDTDSRLVANALIEQSLTDPWLGRYSNANGGNPPTVIVGQFRNRSTEHIPVSTFVNDLENAYINSGAVTVVIGDAQREQIRDERDDQQDNARADTRAGLGQELGANYVLQGELNSMQDEEETTRFGATRKEQIVFYQVDARLVDLESNAVVWAGQHKIKKYIERKPFGL